MAKTKSKKRALSRKKPSKAKLREAPKKRVKRGVKAVSKKKKMAAKAAKRKPVSKNIKKPSLKPKKGVVLKKSDLKVDIEPKKPTLEQKERMKKTVTILSDAYIRQTLIEVGGENALAIVRNFYGNHSDEELAKKLKIKISDVRATLNKLHNEGLVNYIRQKDNETGWYSYSWSLNHGRMEKWATDQTDKLSGTVGDGEKYYCPSCGASTISCFEEAAAGDFKCCQCSRMMEFLDKEKLLELAERRRLQ